MSEKINVEIDVGKVIKFNVNSMQKWRHKSMQFEIYLHKITGFDKRASARKPLYSCSRIRVVDVHWNRGQSKNQVKPVQNASKICVGKVMHKSMKIHPKLNPKREQKPFKNQSKISVFFGPVPKRLFEPPGLLPKGQNVAVLILGPFWASLWFAGVPKSA